MKTPTEAKAVIKAVNRHIKKSKLFTGGKVFGVDANTWRVTCPKVAEIYQQAAEIYLGRAGRFVPYFN